MIQYDKDGITLFFVDATGKKVSRNYMNGSAFDDMVKVRDAQLMAIKENTQAQSNYETALANDQESINAGRPVPAPPKPAAKIVSDTGEVTYGAFDPPLKDLVQLHTPTPPPQGTGIVQPSVDKQAIMYNMILAMFRKEFPEAQ